MKDFEKYDNQQIQKKNILNNYENNSTTKDSRLNFTDDKGNNNF